MSIQVKNAKSITLNGNEVKQIRDLNGNVLWSKTVEPNWLKLTAVQDNSTINYKTQSSGLDTSGITYSYDGETWLDWSTPSIITLNNNEFIYVKNTKDTLSTYSNYFSFIFTGKIAASGNVNSMINFASLTVGCFFGLFYDCDALTTAPKLPATAIAAYCYHSMFRNCTSLTLAPSLPATTLDDYCYEGMFYGCSSLTTAPELPATTLAASCYGGMFQDCTSLKVNENGSGTKIFTCPSLTGIYYPVRRMFNNTGGTFTDDPTENNTYYWY